MTTSLDIVNRALVRLGQDPADSIEDPISKNEKTMALFYDSVREALLAYHPWDFAEGRYSCSRVGTPAFDYTDSYKLPINFLELVEIKDAETGESFAYSSEYGEVDWSREDNNILLNAGGADTVNIVYTKNITDASKFSKLFVKALEVQLAAETAYNITKDAKLEAKLIELSADALNKATSVDGQGKRVRRKEYSRAIAARQGGLGTSSNPYRIR